MDLFFLYASPPVMQRYIEFVRIYATFRRTWDRAILYYTDQFKIAFRFFLHLSLSICSFVCPMYARASLCSTHRLQLSRDIFMKLYKPTSFNSTTNTFRNGTDWLAFSTTSHIMSYIKKLLYE